MLVLNVGKTMRGIQKIHRNAKNKLNWMHRIRCLDYRKYIQPYIKSFKWLIEGPISLGKEI